MRSFTSFDSFLVRHKKKTESTMDALNIYTNIIDREINKPIVTESTLKELVEIEQDEIARNKQELQDLNKNIFDLYFEEWKNNLIAAEKRGDKKQ